MGIGKSGIPLSGEIDPADQEKLDFLNPAPTEDADLDQMNTDIDTLLAKGDAAYLGPFADAAALNLAHPPAGVTIGSTATVLSPDGNLFFLSGITGLWEDTGTGYLGDMLKSVYDPTNKSVDVYDYANAIGTTQGTGGILSHTLTGATNNFNPPNFLTYNYFIFDLSSDENFTGWEAPPAGVERIIRGVNVSDKKIKFKNNDSGSSAGNRLMLRDKADKDCKKGEPFGFRYLHSQSIWVTEIRIG